MPSPGFSNREFSSPSFLAAYKWSPSSATAPRSSLAPGTGGSSRGRRTGRRAHHSADCTPVRRGRTRPVAHAPAAPPRPPTAATATRPRPSGRLPARRRPPRRRPTAPGPAQVAFNLDGHQKTIWDLRLSPDEKMLYSASADRTARIWRLNDGLVRGPALAPGGLVGTSVLASQGVCPASDPLCRRRRRRLGPQCTVVLEGHTRDVLCVSGGANWADVFTGGADCCVRHWRRAPAPSRAHTRLISSRLALLRPRGSPPLLMPFSPLPRRRPH